MLAKLEGAVRYAPPETESCGCGCEDDAPELPAGRFAAEPAPAEGEIAYVMKGFPRLSETFIANEIFLLEEMGLRLRLYSVKREKEPKVHAVVGKIRAPLRYLAKATSLSGTTLPAWLRVNLPTFWPAHRALLSRAPLNYIKVAASALAMTWRYRLGAFKLRKVFVKEFLQAGEIAADILERGSVTHLHGHFCHGVTTITWFVSRLTGIPFSFTAHAKDIYQPDLNPGDLLGRKLAAARFAVTCTGANAAHLKQHYPEAAGVRTIYHGLDTRYFAPREQRDESMPLILSVGRFVAKKGFTYLIEACAQLKREGLHFACYIVGEKGDAYEDMRALIEQHGLAEQVVLHGPVTQEELREIYARARVFALPCQVMDDGDRDGIPNVLAEAMASGVPVVATRISGIPELIEDGRHGLLVESRDVAGLADALRRMVTDLPLRNRLAVDGRARICEVFDSTRTTRELKALFVEAMRVRA